MDVGISLLGVFQTYFMPKTLIFELTLAHLKLSKKAYSYLKCSHIFHNLIVSKMKFKTVISCHLKLVRMVYTKRSETSAIGLWRSRNPHTLWVFLQ